ncbi:MAG: serine--tRNA ligase [Candidatus Levybacteria bacterium RIFOXYA1_FULL_41_10]|nr:MAG: Serine-tRNA ligase [Candidatus Levybacteria bacterium GW2011_GWA1_39_32]KKR51682.1 MAG: seryl-tRNA synthetase, seryl-tRNA synthetase [Candidatus Levybacteria bacterium GW2011_GWC1_40_19]KKR95291.1 MAG: Serine-tRNA ligase [Candidatus Levybacteria bacterium GW2011_GWA2_41_15]KKS00261.1 MAG: Serine-tRNA ligase [Candidatus Levybacteria bacterium GW2011_GWB1_41_21]OGH21049.1 MAG: serine--tRNA ligase [Candidatus Levybacteria bacterium RIFCSPHIGHO2_01_FULL_40_83]OGH25306.1 MAG: serine--tRNA l
MLDIQFIRENPSLVQKAAESKGTRVSVDHLLEIDHEVRKLSQEVQALREERNKLAKERNVEKGKELKITLEKKEASLSALEEELKIELFKIPNLPKKDVKVGKDESENEVLRKEGEPRKLDFPAKDHLELGEALNIIDVKTASKVSGPRFAYLKNEGVLLEFALVQLALETLIHEGFIPIVPPVLIKTEVMKGLGYMENGGDEDMFHISPDGFTLVGTAEHAIVPMHRDETFQKKDLPLRYVGFSTAFRREAGSYGKDTKGILRVHQFDKVEMVSFVEEGKDDEEHEYLLSLEEKLFQALKIPYQVVKMVTGDLGFPAARKYDIEAWMPGQGEYREITSVSTVTDFQSRRLNIRYQDGPDKKYVNVLNGTAFAIGRTLIAVLENYQQQDGSVLIPDVLQKYLGKEKISQTR